MDPWQYNSAESPTRHAANALVTVRTRFTDTRAYGHAHVVRTSPYALDDTKTLLRHFLERITVALLFMSR
jgi:hypothetical protein